MLSAARSTLKDHAAVLGRVQKPTVAGLIRVPGKRFGSPGSRPRAALADFVVVPCGPGAVAAGHGAPFAAGGGAEPLLDYAAGNGIAFIPWFPLATGALAGPGSPLAQLAAERGATPSQLVLAWLLRRSPVMLPIPGTSKVSHLEDNIAGAAIELTDEQFAELNAITG